MSHKALVMALGVVRFAIRLGVSLFLVGTLGLVFAWAQLANGDPAIRVVGSAQVNVRSEPQLGDETLVGQVARGTLLKRVDKRDGWYQVQLPDDSLVWIHGRYVQEEVARDLVEVIQSVVNVRANGTSAAREVGTVRQGDMLPVLHERNGWYYILLPNGKQGWIRNDMVVLWPLSKQEPKPVADLVGPEREPESESEPEPESESEPDLPQITESSADSVDQYQKGKELLIENRVDDALVAFQKAAENRPEDANVHFDLAKVFKQKNQIDDALVHFRQAQKLGRDEAKFFIEEILTARDGTPSPAVPVALAVVPEEDWLSDWLAWINIEMLLPALTLGGVVFLGILGFLLWRRRQNLKLGNTRRKGKQPFDSALKNVAEKRPLLRSIEEAERKRSELDAALQQRLSAFEIDSSDGRPRLPAGESSEKLLKKIDDLRKVIVNQEERAQIYSDLIVLQSEKLAALDEEVDALKKLIQIDNQTGSAKPDARSGRQSK